MTTDESSTDMSSTTWAVLWSHSTNAMHIAPFEDVIAGNRAMYVNNETPQYVPLFVGGKVECMAEHKRIRAHQPGEQHEV